MLHDDNPLPANARVPVAARVLVSPKVAASAGVTVRAGVTADAAYGVIRTTTLPNCAPDVRRA